LGLAALRRVPGVADVQDHSGVVEVSGPDGVGEGSSGEEVTRLSVGW
jgi:hypothetical protein